MEYGLDDGEKDILSMVQDVSEAIECGYPPVTNMLKKEYEVQKDE